MRKQKKKPDPQFCKCGCGVMTTFRKGKYSTYLVGHFRKINRVIVTVPCACGCGNTRPSLDTNGNPRIYILGHYRRGKPSPNKGRRLSEEWKQNMSYALVRSWKQRKKLISK